MHGTRQPTDPDPLMGMDFFLGSNMSLKNPRFRSLRCGECHAGGTLTDHTFEVSHQMTFIDWIHEFVTPGHELFPEPLTRGRLAHPFALEGELQENAQDGIERNVVDKELDEFGSRGWRCWTTACTTSDSTHSDDVGRGGPDPFGWPLSLSYLALKTWAAWTTARAATRRTVRTARLRGSDAQLGAQRGCSTRHRPGRGVRQRWVVQLQPARCSRQRHPTESDGAPGDPTGGGLLAPTGQDFQINPGFAEEPFDPQLPPYLAKWASNINVGDETVIDEVFVGLNTLLHEPILEGFVDTWGPFNPAATVSEVMNNARQVEMGTWPNVNRVNVGHSTRCTTWSFRSVSIQEASRFAAPAADLRSGRRFPDQQLLAPRLPIIHFDIEDEALAVTLTRRHTTAARHCRGRAGIHRGERGDQDRQIDPPSLSDERVN
jgi:hypothetical protein